jgi:hypothetical protein
MEAHNSFWKLPDLKHYYDPLYVGKVVAREVAEMHYSASTFYFDYHELHLVHKFLAVDRFDYGIRPSSLVKDIEVVLDASSTCSCNSAALAWCGLAPAPMSSADAIKWCLEQFFGLSARPARIKIIVLQDWANSGKQWVHKRFSVLLAIVKAFIVQARSLGFRTAFTLFDFHGHEWSIDDTVAGGIERALQEISDMETLGHGNSRTWSSWCPCCSLK